MPALPPYKRQIYNLLGLLSAAIISALFLVAFIVYYYGPEGNYLAHHTLLEPQLIKTLNYNDTNIKTGGMSRFVYNGILFDFYDRKGKAQQIEISQDKYDKFYQMTTGDKSIMPVADNVVSLFSKPLLNTLSINVRTESHAAWQDESKHFQEIQFAPQENYYRIQLRTDPTTQQWVYFKHPDIYQKTLQLFTQ